MFQKLWSWLKQPEVTQKIRDIGDYLRYGVVAVALVVALVTQQLFWPLLWSAILAQIAVELLKKVFDLTPWGRRPDGADGGFPSGHVAGAFSGAWYFYFVFGPLVALVPLALGAFTGLSRVLPMKHTWGAVAASVVVTYLISGYFLS